MCRCTESAQCAVHSEQQCRDKMQCRATRTAQLTAPAPTRAARVAQSSPVYRLIYLTHSQWSCCSCRIFDASLFAHCKLHTRCCTLCALVVTCYVEDVFITSSARSDSLSPGYVIINNRPRSLVPRLISFSTAPKPFVWFLFSRSALIIYHFPPFFRRRAGRGTAGGGAAVYGSRYSRSRLVRRSLFLFS